jgi:hypothetical protein
MDAAISMVVASAIIISVVCILLFRFDLVGTVTNSILFAVSLFDCSCDAIERSRGYTFCWWLCLVHLSTAFIISMLYYSLYCLACYTCLSALYSVFYSQFCSFGIVAIFSGISCFCVYVCLLVG